MEKVGVDAAGAAAAHGRRSWASEGPACLPESQEVLERGEFQGVWGVGLVLVEVGLGSAPGEFVLRLSVWRYYFVWFGAGTRISVRMRRR